MISIDFIMTKPVSLAMMVRKARALANDGAGMALAPMLAAAALGGAASMSLPDGVRVQSLPVIEVNREVGLAFRRRLLNCKEHVGDDAWR